MGQYGPEFPNSFLIQFLYQIVEQDKGNSLSSFKMAAKAGTSVHVIPRKIAIYQGVVKVGDKSFNISKMKDNIKKAGELGAELIVFPELFTTGYCLTDEEVGILAENSDGETFCKISECAKEHQIAVVYGYPERDGVQIFNSAILIGKDGYCRLNYRKVHLCSDWERNLFTEGNDVNVVDVEGLKLGLLICYDYDFPEMTRLLAVKGAHVIIIPTAIVEEWDYEMKIVPLVRAYENGVFVVFVNHFGPQRDDNFSGGSCCVDPNGVELVRSWGQESLLTVNIDPKECGRTKNKFLADRRPEVYGSIAQ